MTDISQDLCLKIRLSVSLLCCVYSSVYGIISKLNKALKKSQKVIGPLIAHTGYHLQDTLFLQTQQHLKDETNPSYHLSLLLPSGRGCRAFTAHTSRLKNSFFHRADSKLKSYKRSLLLPALPASSKIDNSNICMQHTDHALV